MNSRVAIVLLVANDIVYQPVSPCPQELSGSTAISSQELLPASTKAWLSIPDSKELDAKFLETQLGKMTHDEKLKPFITALRGQLKDWMNEKNVRLGLDVDSIEDVPLRRKFCVAGILPPQVPGDGEKLGRGSHGSVLLVDVSTNVKQAQELLAKVAVELKKRGATEEEYDDVFGVQVSKWKFPKKRRLAPQRFAYQAIAEGWLLSCDNESVFRKIVRRLVNIDNANAHDTLASQAAFQNVMKSVQLADVDPQVQWFVNPFGYIQLARAIAREQEEIRLAKDDDWARILKKIGFDGFKGVGGYVAFATGKHDILHRTYVYRPTPKGQEVNQQWVFRLFDFTNLKGTDLAPPKFVSDSASGYFCAAWNMQKAFESIGFVVDTFTKKEGSFDGAIDTLKVQMNVDIPAVVGKFDNEIVVVSETVLPIDAGSEHLTIGIRSNANPKQMMEVVKRSYPDQHITAEFKGIETVEIDETIGSDVDDDDLPGEDIYGNLDDDDEEEEEEEEAQFSVFERRICSANDKFFFVANDDKPLHKALNGEADKPLAESPDYMRVSAALEEIQNSDSISFRQFSRLDQIIRPNYEMMRAGKMAASNTILSRLLNHLFVSNSKDKNAVRKQKIDGSKLPSDFEKDVAPFFGPSGWVMESDDEGWLFSGVVLTRAEQANQLVKRPEDHKVQKK